MGTVATLAAGWNRNKDLVGKFSIHNRHVVTVVIGCTPDSDASEVLSVSRHEKLVLSSTLIKMRDERWPQLCYLDWAPGSYERCLTTFPIY